MGNGNAKTQQNHIRHGGNRYREGHRQYTAANATAYWFSGAAIFAFLAAGVIIFHVAAADIRLAPSDIKPMSVAATSTSVEQPPIHAHVEGVDP